MDYSEIYNIMKAKALISGVSIEQIESEETLYYDESGNVKHLIVNGGSLNAKSDTVFVLGGIQADNTISVESLKLRLGKRPTSELKAKNDLKGDFVAMLRKDNFCQILELIQEKRWHIHFHAIHILYYGFVDIIDSIKGTEISPLEFKAELYQVLKKNLIKTVNHFKKYKYPNIKDKNIKEFLDGITSMIDDYIRELESRCLINPLLISLRTLFDAAKAQKGLDFIQQEETNVWVKPFIQFYRQEILQFCNKKLRFDEEKQVQKELEKEDLKIDGKLLTNYCFVNSETDGMIQVCDYIVSIIRKYIIFLDRPESEINMDIMAFDQTQMQNYKLFNSVLKRSLDYNPMYLNFTVSLYTYKKNYEIYNRIL